jgi:hypothetical protein
MTAASRSAGSGTAVGASGAAAGVVRGARRGAVAVGRAIGSRSAPAPGIEQRPSDSSARTTRSSVPGDVGQLVRVEPEVERMEHRAEQRNGAYASDAGRGSSWGGDAVAGAHAERLECGGEPPGAAGTARRSVRWRVRSTRRVITGRAVRRLGPPRDGVESERIVHRETLHAVPSGNVTRLAFSQAPLPPRPPQPVPSPYSGKVSLLPVVFRPAGVGERRIRSHARCSHAGRRQYWPRTIRRGDAAPHLSIRSGT